LEHLFPKSSLLVVYGDANLLFSSFESTGVMGADHQAWTGQVMVCQAWKYRRRLSPT
jgi:hypothetical protein